MVDSDPAAPDPDSVSGTHGPDPTEQNFWRPLRALLDELDDEITRLYDDRGVRGIRPRFTTPLIRLGRSGPMTIGGLAKSLGHTHSATSQTVAALRRADLVTSAPGVDARTRELHLTERARRLIPFLEAEWRATEQAMSELDAEIPYSLQRVVADLRAALERRSFTDRIAQHLAEQGWEST